MSKSQTEKWAKEYVSQYMDELKWRRDASRVIRIIQKALDDKDYLTLKYIINSTKHFVGEEKFGET